jgi:hypothetical protein
MFQFLDLCPEIQYCLGQGNIRVGAKVTPTSMGSPTSNTEARPPNTDLCEPEPQSRWLQRDCGITWLEKSPVYEVANTAHL